ncbi:hypothetical protein J3458_009416 [Metarhizium acridum]|uniref:uncharacterized protein n=1 Tax=Metarhizium acridum TaxID=92637 RepID=UPI001C6C8758|nr:hypothetical protein J3458_009416 [Metarhizium acridum]
MAESPTEAAKASVSSRPSVQVRDQLSNVFPRPRKQMAIFALAKFGPGGNERGDSESRKSQRRLGGRRYFGARRRITRHGCFARGGLVPLPDHRHRHDKANTVMPGSTEFATPPSRWLHGNMPQSHCLVMRTAAALVLGLKKKSFIFSCPALVLHTPPPPSYIPPFRGHANPRVR